MEYLISATVFIIIITALYYLVKYLIKQNVNQLIEIENNKRIFDSSEVALLEEKHNQLENEHFDAKFNNFINNKDMYYVKRSFINIAKSMKKLVEETPSHINFECNFILETINIKTSHYVKPFFEELIQSSLSNNSNKIQIRFEDLKKSYKIIYRDDRTSNELIDPALLNKLSMYDSEFSYNYKNGKNKFNLEIDFHFNKYDGKTKIGRFYTHNEIEKEYGSEIVDEKVMSRNEALRYINQTKDYVLFKLDKDHFDLAKTVLKKRFSLINGKVISEDVIYRIFSKCYLEELLRSSKAENIAFQNRRNNSGKVTFVIAYGEKYLQMSWPCPEFCADRINDILN
jgi:hypothetical protein